MAKKKGKGLGKVYNRKCRKCGHTFRTRSKRTVCGLCSITYSDGKRRF